MIKLTVNNTTFIIPPAEIVTIKVNHSDEAHTLLDILQGKSKEGVKEYYFEGVNVDNFSQRQLSYLRKKEVINISDETFIMGDYTVEKNLQMQLKFSGIYPTKGKRIIDAVLKEVHLKELKDKKAAELSPLQQLTLRVAKALVVDPKVVCGLFNLKELGADGLNLFTELIEGLKEKQVAVIVVTTEPKANGDKQ